ncbi:DUF3558 domain-containing protein [Actinokineospora sp. PR83]|uniref:DUF3558 domain-containing protein n=1 Tax=Actinokineospora sp. PR83 TaxID=2884908 RepID=UPI0027E10528|nr:DUF3558 family protein [Actinokineospora sp. PR83]MCG8920799.1 DUF3558 domain-containing protein [Actinokineospora sp. PR83]
MLVFTVVSGCSTKTAGSAVPGVVDSGAPEPSTTPTRSTSESGGPTRSGSSAASIDPCALFTPATKAALGVTGPAKPDETRIARFCQWKVDKGSIADSYHFTVAVFPELGIDQLVADGEKKSISVGSRRAVQAITQLNDVCMVSIELTATSRVDVTGIGTGGTMEPAVLCPKVLDAAKLVEPELP